MATLSCQLFMLGSPLLVRVLGCTQQKPVLVTFHKVEIYWQGASSSRIEAGELRVQPPGGKQSPPFQFGILPLKSQTPGRST